MADNHDQERFQSGDIRPIPDPTVLTTAASERLESTLRRLIQSEVSHQSAILDEKFARIEAEFRYLEARTAEQKSDTKIALDSALAAQKEAVASQTASSDKSITKSETATVERIKAVENLLAASTKALDDKLNDLKDRLVAMEASRLGRTEQLGEGRAGAMDLRGNMASIISIVTTVIAVASIIITIIVVTKP